MLSRARKAGAPILHIVHKGRPGGLFDPDGNGGKVIERVSPFGETVIFKTLPNAFAKTDLDARLAVPIACREFLFHLPGTNQQVVAAADLDVLRFGAAVEHVVGDRKAERPVRTARPQ